MHFGRKLCTLVTFHDTQIFSSSNDYNELIDKLNYALWSCISMLMSTLQNVGSYTGRAYENPYMGCLISTRKLCTLVISMLMSTLQNVGSYTGRAYENPYIGCLISTRKLCTLVIIKQAHEHITECWYIRGVLMRIPIWGVS